MPRASSNTSSRSRKAVTATVRKPKRVVRVPRRASSAKPDKRMQAEARTIRNVINVNVSGSRGKADVVNYRKFVNGAPGAKMEVEGASNKLMTHQAQVQVYPRMDPALSSIGLDMLKSAIRPQVTVAPTPAAPPPHVQALPPQFFTAMAKMQEGNAKLAETLIVQALRAREVSKVDSTKKSKLGKKLAVKLQPKSYDGEQRPTRMEDLHPPSYEGEPKPKSKAIYPPDEDSYGPEIKDTSEEDLTSAPAPKVQSASGVNLSGGRIPSVQKLGLDIEKSFTVYSAPQETSINVGATPLQKREGAFRQAAIYADQLRARTNGNQMLKYFNKYRDGVLGATKPDDGWAEPNDSAQTVRATPMDQEDRSLYSRDGNVDNAQGTIQTPAHRRKYVSEEVHGMRNATKEDRNNPYFTDPRAQLSVREHLVETPVNAKMARRFVR